jgi:hypothetical protein
MPNIPEDEKKVNSFSIKNLERFFIFSLPSKLACTNTLGNLTYEARKIAIEKNYLQANPAYSLNWLVYDVDKNTSIYEWYDLDAPAPNFIATNRLNGHSHIFYGLNLPVYKQSMSSFKTLSYTADIDRALTYALGADRSFAGFLTKNPISENWITTIPQTDLYDLSDFLDNRLILSHLKKHETDPIIGLGRNCTLFDTVRTWAYKEVKHFFNNSTLERFFESVLSFSLNYNKTVFYNPLPFLEVKDTAKSIARWTWKNFSPKVFSIIQQRRAKKLSVIRKEKVDARAVEIIKLKEKNTKMTNKKIAEIFGISVPTVKRALASRK